MEDMSEALEQRVELLEAEIARLRDIVEKSARAETSDMVPWWKKRVGTFANEPMYDEAMELGRQYRESLRSEETETASGEEIATSSLTLSQSDNKQLSQSQR